MVGDRSDWDSIIQKATMWATRQKIDPGWNIAGEGVLALIPLLQSDPYFDSVIIDTQFANLTFRPSWDVQIRVWVIAETLDIFLVRNHPDPEKSVSTLVEFTQLIPTIKKYYEMNNKG